MTLDKLLNFSLVFPLSVDVRIAEAVVRTDYVDTCTGLETEPSQVGAMYSPAILIDRAASPAGSRTPRIWAKSDFSKALPKLSRYTTEDHLRTNTDTEIHTGFVTAISLQRDETSLPGSLMITFSPVLVPCFLSVRPENTLL